ncbi:MAG: hypothetical protein PVJ09_01945 [Candidatus Woesebacteria bacterium]|jgi:hypothetical protein
MRERLNLREKEDWTVGNAPMIARTLGFVCNDQFIAALDSFIKEVVKTARMTGFLAALAINFFKRSNLK